jgi:uncharacterized protein YjbI with pentapeptide repeats
MIIENELSKKQLLDELQNGKHYFYRIEVEDLALINMDLKNVIFDECILSIDFTGANLTNAKFTNSNLKTCTFSGTNLTNAIMVGNLLDATEFKGAIIQGITFKNNTYHSATLTISHLEDLIK